MVVKREIERRFTVLNYRWRPRARHSHRLQWQWGLRPRRPLRRFRYWPLRLRRWTLHRPAHPYAQALVSAIPHPGRRGGRILLQGDPPNPADRPSGCAFHPRCAHAMPMCREVAPVLADRGDGRLVACHLAQDAA
jgi:oligopeptide/dipeptide ABC transporter ATP-binding protein